MRRLRRNRYIDFGARESLKTSAHFVARLIELRIKQLAAYAQFELRRAEAHRANACVLPVRRLCCPSEWLVPKRGQLLLPAFYTRQLAACVKRPRA